MSKISGLPQNKILRDYSKNKQTPANLVKATRSEQAASDYVQIAATMPKTSPVNRAIKRAIAKLHK